MNIELMNKGYQDDCRCRNPRDIESIVVHVLTRHNPNARNCAMSLIDRIPMYHYIADSQEIYLSVPSIYVIENDVMYSKQNQGAIHVAVLIYEGESWCFDTLANLIAALEYEYRIDKVYLYSDSLIHTRWIEILTEEVKERVDRLAQAKGERRTWTKEDQDAFYEWF